MFVKICGLTDEQAVDAAVSAGADAIGFVFAESVRKVSPRSARALCRGISPDTIRVAVMHHPRRDLYDEVRETFAPDWIQTDAEDFATLPACEPALALPVFRDQGADDLTDLPARLLFEGRSSGSGTTADWDQASRIARRTQLILAGGLSIDNVAEAIARVRPFGIDVSSGVERERGRKDPNLIKQFVARVRAEESNR